jgi:class 3 adenylate cyclase/tetratricopeptide (TPR) repeat protein
MSKPDESAPGPGGDNHPFPFDKQPNTSTLVVSEGERKVVTIFFADVVRSLSYSQNVDDEQFRDRLDWALSLMVDAVKEFGGSVLRVQGDGVLALFGAPKAQEDHAVRACLAALHLRNAITCRARSHAEDIRFEARIGLHTGEAIVRSLDTALTHDYDAVGKAVHIGARTEQLCRPGSVLVTGHVLAHTRGLFEVKGVAGQMIRGTDEPYEFFELVAKLPDHAAADHVAQRSNPILGREAILAQFDKIMVETTPTTPTVHRIEGEAGYGKTRLILEIARRAERAGLRVVETKGVSHFSDVPYLSIRILILRVLGLEDREDADASKPSLADALDQIDPLTALDRIAVLNIMGAVRKDAAWDALNPTERRTQLRQALVTLWRFVAGRRACLLIMEDLHWMDHTSLEVLDSIVATSHGRQFLAIGTHRQMKQELPEVIGRAPVTRLEPLSTEETNHLIALVSADPNMPRAEQETIARRSAGVPFYVHELVRHHVATQSNKELARAGSDRTSVALLERGHSDIPLAIEASILARVDRLPEASVRIAHTAAVIGPVCDWEIIKQASGVAEIDIEPTIALLVDAGLLERTDISEHRHVAFHHEITRDVLLRTIVRNRRRVIHQAVLRAMEERWGRDAKDAWQVHSLAFHAEAANRWPEALEYLTRACHQAVRNSSAEEAVRLYDRARDAISELGDQDCRTKELDLRLLVSQAYLALGEISRMSETLAAAADIAEALGDKRRLALVTAQHATSQWMIGDHAAAAQSAQFVLDQTEGTGSLALQIFAKFMLANALHGQGRLEEAIALHQQIIESLENLGLEHERLGWAGLPSVMSRAYLCWFLIENGRFDEARKHIDRGNIVSAAVRQPYSQIHIQLGEGLYHMRRGYPENAVPILEPALKMCQHVYSMEPMVAGWLGTALVQLGRAAEALAVTEDSFARQMHLRGGNYTRFYLFKAIGEANAAIGNTEEALLWVEKAIDVAHKAKEILHYAQGLKCRGDMRLLLAPSEDSCIGDLEQAKEIGSRHGLAPLVAECDLSLAQACQRLGRDQDARQFAHSAGRAFRALNLERYLVRAEALVA